MASARSRGMTWRGLWLLVAVGALLCGCQKKDAAPERSAALPVSFTDVSQTAGIDFVHHSGAVGKKYMPETVGSGCAFLDYDGDGGMDLLYVNGTDWPSPKARPHYPALYRNNRDGT